MKVKCIDNEGLNHCLTKDKIYNVGREDDVWYYLLDDNNDFRYYLKARFEIVTEPSIVTMARQIGELVEKKEEDYNNSFSKTLHKYGNVAYFIKVDDKLNRLKSILLNNKDTEVNENVEDILKDIIGYTLLMLKEIKNNLNSIDK